MIKHSWTLKKIVQSYKIKECYNIKVNSYCYHFLEERGYTNDSTSFLYRDLDLHKYILAHKL